MKNISFLSVLVISLAIFSCKEDPKDVALKNFLNEFKIHSKMEKSHVIYFSPQYSCVCQDKFIYDFVEKAAQNLESNEYLFFTTDKEHPLLKLLSPNIKPIFYDQNKLFKHDLYYITDRLIYLKSSKVKINMELDDSVKDDYVEILNTL
ncbi:hypothetical protein [Peijinzhouia sedimentorum]